MSVFTPLSILILSTLIIASMKLIPGIFALFYHYASGKYSVKKVSNLSIFFILGVETLPVFILTILNFFTFVFFFTNRSSINGVLLWSIIGSLFALGLAFSLFYFRRSSGTELFISRHLASSFEEKAKLVKKPSDAYILGLISGIPELIFTLPLYFIVFITITKSFIVVTSCSTILMSFILLTISPLFFLYAYFRTDNNLANFMKLRTKNKNFFRFFVSILYFLLAILIIIFEVVF